MDCGAAQKNIDLYIDGMLDDVQARQLEQHVGVCAACKTALDDARRLQHALGVLYDLEPPEGLAQSAIRKARRRPVFTYVTAATAVAAAAIAVIAVLATGTPDMNRAEVMTEEEIIMFSADSAADEPAAMEMAPQDAPRDAEAGVGKAEDVLMDDALQGEAAENDSGLRTYDGEQDLAASINQSYYKPAVLPAGASLENITDSGASVVYTYRLSGGDWYYFEWLAGVPQGGIENEIISRYGGTDLFSRDEGHYIFIDGGMATVYWEQHGQAFRVLAPERIEDIKAYCVAERVEQE